MSLTSRERQEIAQANTTGLRPVVFVHGLWMLASSWAPWRAFFEENGYATLAPGWPDDPETVDQARANPQVFARKSVKQVTDHMAEAIGRLSQPPAVIGHSFGGLITQQLAGRGLSAVSVPIDSAPFRGVLPLPVSALRSALPVIGNPANYRRAVALTYDQFRYSFANAVSESEAKRLYETYPVAGLGDPAVPGRHREPQSVYRDQGRHEDPAARPHAPDHRGKGPHRAIRDRQRLIQEAEAQRRGDQHPRDPESRALARFRQRLAGDRRNSSGLCQGTPLTEGRRLTVRAV